MTRAGYNGMPLGKNQAHPIPWLPPPLWERSEAERLSERFQPCLILAESGKSMSQRFQPFSLY